MENWRTSVRQKKLVSICEKCDPRQVEARSALGFKREEDELRSLFSRLPLMIMMMMDNNNITRSAHLAAPPRLIPASSSLFTFIFRRILIIVALILAHESTQVFASSSSLAERCSASLQCADEPGNGQLLLHQQQQVPSNKEPLPVVCGSDGKTYAR